MSLKNKKSLNIIIGITWVKLFITGVKLKLKILEFNQIYLI